jgi:hypothetical protein
MRGQPQDYDLDTSGSLLLPHHIMLLISNKEIFYLHDTPMPTNFFSSPNK